MTEEFAGKVGIVTGAGAGIGAAVAARLAQGGARMLLCDIDLASVTKTAESITQKFGLVAEVIQLDVADEAGWQSAVARAVDRFGSLSLAFNNAGIAGDNPIKLADHTLSSFRKVMAVNVEGVFLGMRAQIPAMIAAGGGAIVNTSSVLGGVGAEGVSLYVASKHAVVGLTRAAALDYATANIRVNAIGPGPVRTAILDTYDDAQMAAAVSSIPMGRLGTVHEIAEIVAFLLSGKASFMTGGFYYGDGGYTVR